MHSGTRSGASSIHSNSHGALAGPTWSILRSLAIQARQAATSSFSPMIMRVSKESMMVSPRPNHSDPVSDWGWNSSCPNACCLHSHHLLIPVDLGQAFPHHSESETCLQIQLDPGHNSMLACRSSCLCNHVAELGLACPLEAGDSNNLV